MKSNLSHSLIYLAILGVMSACSDIKLQSPAPEVRTVQVKVASYCPQDGRSLVNVFTSNLSTQIGANQVYLDTDRDGLTDIFEQGDSVQDAYNISSSKADANGDGYSDLFSYNIGYQAEMQANLTVCEQIDLDTDRDGISDCEEAVLGSDPKNPDSDFDGIPDGLEFRFGLNPKVHDSELDPDGDGMSNLEEVRNNGLIYTNQNTQTLKHNLAYSLETFVNQDNIQCYEFFVSNIPLVNVSNGNMIKLSFLERKTVEGQGQVNFLRDITIIASRNFATGHQFDVEDVLNQTLTEVP